AIGAGQPRLPPAEPLRHPCLRRRLDQRVPRTTEADIVLSRLGQSPRFVINEWLKAIQPFRSTAATDSEVGASHRSSLHRFPLTPALSLGALGERENRSPPGEASSGLDGSQWVQALFPLPPGEGQGEGEPQELRSRVSNQSRNRRTP